MLAPMARLEAPSARAIYLLASTAMCLAALQSTGLVASEFEFTWLSDAAALCSRNSPITIVNGTNATRCACDFIADDTCDEILGRDATLNLIADGDGTTFQAVLEGRSVTWAIAIVFVVVGCALVTLGTLLNARRISQGFSRKDLVFGALPMALLLAALGINIGSTLILTDKVADSAALRTFYLAPTGLAEFRNDSSGDAKRAAELLMLDAKAFRRSVGVATFLIIPILPWGFISLLSLICYCCKSIACRKPSEEEVMPVVVDEKRTAKVVSADSA